MLRLGIQTLKNWIEPPSYARTAYVVAIWPSFLFDSFVKIWATCRFFFGQFTAPLGKKFPVRLWLHITWNQYRNLLSNNPNQDISYIDLIHKVESLIFENFQILHHAKNRNSDMQESYKRNFLHLTSCMHKVESLIFEKFQITIILKIDIPICNNHNKEILIFELTLPNITPPSFYLGFTVPL